MTGQDFRNIINEIRDAMLSGKITYDEAKVRAQPFIDEMNEKARAIAAKYGKKHQGFTFASLMR